MLEVSRELYDYWRKLKGKRRAPDRNDVEPGAIRAILSDTFILDFDREQEFPFRISGTRANALFLRELRGSSFLHLWRAADRNAIATTLQRSADHARPYLLDVEARPPGLGRLAMEILLLPLRHQGSAHGRILGAITTDASPHWLGFVGAGEVALISAHPIAEQRSAALETRPRDDGIVKGFAPRPRLYLCSSDHRPI